MRTTFLSRIGGLMAGLAVLAGSALSTSCGGAADNASTMVLLEVLYVDRALVPVVATESSSVPRNAQILFKFSELVSATTVTEQTIQIRDGAGRVPEGSFSVNGSQVRFDPTVTIQGQPNPEGLAAGEQYSIYLPSYEIDQSELRTAGVVENRDNDPLARFFDTEFSTSAGWLRELVPPQVLEVYFIPTPDALTGNTPGNGQMVFRFSEPMSRSSFVTGPSTLPVDTATNIDVRYDPAEQVNIDNNVAGNAIPGYFTFDASLTLAYFNPTFSFGNRQFEFYAQCFQGLRDLSGNLLINPRTFGTYKCDGRGLATGKILTERFASTTDRDNIATDADWGQTTPNELAGAPVTYRDAYIMGYEEAGNTPNSGRGQYAPLADPMNSSTIYAVTPAYAGPDPQLGRRVMITFSDIEVGQKGTITTIKWGPDSNSTYASTYSSVIMRLGFQAEDSNALGSSFSPNFQGGQGTTVFSGRYDVATSGVPNTPGQPAFNHVGGYQQNPGCQTPPDWNSPLFTSTGFYSWPALTAYFDWDPGDVSVDNDSVLVFDVSCTEGDNFQLIRTWFGVTYPCSGVLIGGYPQRRLYSIYEDEAANPQPNFAGGVLNPEPSMFDTALTLAKRVSQAQSLFYTAPGFASQAAGGNTFGALSNYLPAEITPAIQPGGATVRLEFQAAQIVELDRRTINVAYPFQDWTTDINLCDGYANIRWRASLVSNLVTSTTARVNKITIPMTSN